jgi:hypothetical protein
MAEAQNALQARGSAPSASSRNTVTVACRLTHGLHIQLHEKGQTQDGAPIMQPKGERVFLRGANTSKIINGVGLTEVDADFWNEWLKQNTRFDPVKSGGIFAQGTRQNAIAQAEEMASEKTGFEPINPDKPGEKLNDRRIEKLNSKEAA